MELEYAIETAKELANRIKNNRRILCIEDLMLFGSTCRGKRNPKDLDLMIIHNSDVLEEFQINYQNSNISDSEKLVFLSRMLEAKGINLSEIVKGTRAMNLINLGLLNLGYIGTRFFRDSSYKAEWRRRNIEAHKDKRPHSFEEEIFREGLLFDWNKCEYSLPAIDKYNPSLILS